MEPEDPALDTPLIGGDSLSQPLNGASETTPAQADPPAEPEGDAEADAKAEEEVDYKAKFEAADTELAKLRLDRKAEQTGRQRTAERDALLIELKNEMSAVRETNKVLVKSLNSGQTEDVADQLTEIDQRTESTTAMARIKVQAEALREAFQNLGTRGKVQFNVTSDERFADVVSDWNRIGGDANLLPSEKLAELTSVLTQATILKMGIEYEANEKAVEEAKNAGEVGRKKALEDSNLLDTDTGGRTGPAEVSDARYLEQVAAGGRNDFKKTAKHLQDLDDTPGSLMRGA